MENESNATSDYMYYASAPTSATNLNLHLLCDEKKPCVRITWSRPVPRSKGTHLSGYRLTYQVISPNDLIRHVNKIEKDLRDDQIEYQTEPGELVLGATYRFNLTSLGEYSAGGSTYQDIDMPEGVPVAGPEFKFTDNGDNVGSFSFGPPHARYRNGRIKLYEIHCLGRSIINSQSQRDGIQEYPLLLNVSGETTETKLLQFVAHADYECMARAHTRVGPSTWSSKIFFSTSSDHKSNVIPPTKLRVIRTSLHEMDVFWEAPMPKEQIISFLIYYLPVDNQHFPKEQWFRQNTDTFTTSAIIKDLVGGVKYVVRVSSFSNLGIESYWSYTEKEETARVINDNYNKSPTGLRCVHCQSRSIELEWKQPRSSYYLLRYRVEAFANYTYWTSKGLPKTVLFPTMTERVAIENIQNYNHLLDNLHPNVIYSIKVTAIYRPNTDNDKAILAHNMTLCQTLAEVPMDVPLPKLLKRPDGKVTIQLFRVDEAYGEIDKYHLIAQRIPSTSTSYFKTPLSIPMHELSIKDLHQNLDNLFLNGATSPKEGIPTLVDSFDTSTIFPYNRSIYSYTPKPSTSQIRKNNTLVLRLFENENVQVAVRICLKSQSWQVTSGGSSGTSNACKESNWSTPLSKSETYLSDGTYFTSTNSTNDRLPLLRDPIFSIYSVLLIVFIICAFLFIFLSILWICMCRRRHKQEVHREHTPFHIFGNNHLQPSNNTKSLTYDEVMPESNSAFKLNNFHSSSGLFKHPLLPKKQASVESYTLPGNGKLASSHLLWRNPSGAATSPLVSPHGSLLMNADKEGDYKRDNLLINYPIKTSSTGSSMESTPLHVSRSTVLPHSTQPLSSSSDFSSMAFMGLSQHNNHSCGYHPTLSAQQECLPLLANDHTESLDTGKGSSEINIFQAAIHSPPRAVSPTRPSTFRIQPFLSKSSLERGSPSSASPMSHTNYPLSCLPDYVQQLFANDGDLLHREYSSLERSSSQTIILPGSPNTLGSYLHASFPHNQNKNRYANLIAYDHNRVILRDSSSNLSSNSVSSTPSDYINASYIDGYAKSSAYIATQSPLSHTILDFWHMIWQEECPLIVMLTLLSERGQSKCELYYPTIRRTHMTFGPYTIHLLNEMEHAYYTVRELQLEKVTHYKSSPKDVSDLLVPQTDPNKGNECRKIWHLQFTAWPEYGVPLNPLPFLFFHRRVMALKHLTVGIYPTVVHCSAGIGRTGIFICYDRELQRLQLEGSFDVAQCVRQLRTQRNCMVQTEEQYGFLYRLLLEASRFLGKGDVLCKEFDLYVNKLCHSALTSISQSGLSVEFQSLLLALNDAVIPSSANIGSNWGEAMEYHTAMLPINLHKNRSDASLPLESNRVILQAMRGVEGSDYINATYIDGYRMKKAYIVTQHPLTHTMDDFWRMVWEQNCQIVVMLSLMTECQKEQLPQYWPSGTDTPLRSQNLFVEPQAEYQMTYYTLREFHISDTACGQTRTVRQFHCQLWPSHLRDMSGLSGALELVLQTHRTRDQFGFTDPIVVHCNLASDRCGLFLALSLMTERAISENVVDVLRTVQLLSMQRPNLFRSEAAYELCYLLMLQYLSSRDN